MNAVKLHLGLPALAVACTGLVGLAVGLTFFYAPTDGDQGFSQRIFYFHVPIALTSYVCFGWGAWKALRYLRTRDERADLESYVAIHQGVIFGALTLVTGSIWAKASWGVWWSWSENQLVLFLVLFLFYCAYFMLRFSVEPGPARSNMSAVYALFGVVLIPGLVSRDPPVAEVHSPGRLQLARPPDDRLAVRRLLCVARRRALALRDALPGRARREAPRCARAGAPGAADMSPNPPSEWQYVAAAYLVVFVAVLAWVALIAAKLGRLQKQLGDLVERARDRG